MRVVVIGATGNVGWATMQALAAHPAVDELVGVARRLPDEAGRADLPVAQWRALDLATDDLDVLAGADAVVHLAWRIQPSRDEAALRATNIEGTRRLLEASVEHRVGRVVCASSVGAYGPGPKHPPVDEAWPTTGIATSTYSRHKAAVETLLDAHEAAHPAQAVVRLRTSLVFQRQAASEVHRNFLGRLAPWHLPRPVRVVPRTPYLVAQATHADDVADAYVRAVTQEVRGAFNIAADPPLTAEVLAACTEARTVPVPAGVLRAAAAASFHLRLQPSEPGWLDLALQTPLMATHRAHDELGWTAARSSTEALGELLAGMGDGAGGPTRPLHPR